VIRLSTRVTCAVDAVAAAGTSRTTATAASGTLTVAS
jgi:hypothetical protein